MTYIQILCQFADVSNTGGRGRSRTGGRLLECRGFTTPGIDGDRVGQVSDTKILAG